MSNTYQDNIKARKKVVIRGGPNPWDKQTERKAKKFNHKCSICGNKCRPHKMLAGICPKCLTN